MSDKSLSVEKTKFHERLNKALDKEGFPPKHRGRIQRLADIMGLSHRGVGKWLDGETTPPAKKFPALAEKLHISSDWLKTGKGNMIRESSGNESSANPIAMKEIPLYTIDDLNNPYRTPSQTITCYVASLGRAFAFKVDTEAMSPRVPAGSLIIIDMDRIPKDGDFILGQIERLPGPQFRQLFVAHEVKYLIADNPKFERLTMSLNDKIIGVVVQIVTLFY